MKAADSGEVLSSFADTEPALAIPAQAQEFLDAILRGETDGISCWRIGVSERRSGSKIDGEGLFATAVIPANTVIAIKQGHVVDQKTIEENADIIKGSHQQIGQNSFLTGLTSEEVDKNLVGYNHSCSPNSRVVTKDGIPITFLVASKDIRKGDEITADYSTTFLSRTQAMFDCRCGAKTCRRIVDPLCDVLDDKFQARYAGQFPDWLQREIDYANSLDDTKRAELQTMVNTVRLAREITYMTEQIASYEPIPRSLFRISPEIIRRGLLAIRYYESIQEFARTYPSKKIMEALGINPSHSFHTAEEQADIVRLARLTDKVVYSHINSFILILLVSGVFHNQLEKDFEKYLASQAGDNAEN